MEDSLKSYPFEEILDYLINKRYPENLDRRRRHRTRSMSTKFTEQNRKLYYMYINSNNSALTEVICDLEAQINITAKIHQGIGENSTAEAMGGILDIGSRKTVEKIKARYWWFNMFKIPVLLTAPTGTAAFSIKGMTLHSAFSLSVHFKDGYKNLSSNKLNTLRSCLGKLRLLV